MANEKRLIDANVTKTIIQEEMNKSDFQLFKDVMQCVCNILDHSDTVDAVEVVHGEWINEYDGDWRCSVCRRLFSFDDYGDIHPLADCEFNYCPNCGAYMGALE